MSVDLVTVRWPTPPPMPPTIERWPGGTPIGDGPELNSALWRTGNSGWSDRRVLLSRPTEAARLLALRCGSERQPLVSTATYTFPARPCFWGVEAGPRMQWNRPGACSTGVEKGSSFRLTIVLDPR